MNPLIPFLIPAVAGGLALAVALILRNRAATASLATRPAAPPLSTDVIHFTQLRVAGVGGLGLVAMAAIVAWNIPRIRIEMGISLTAGATLAVGLVAWRRHH